MLEIMIEAVPLLIGAGLGWVIRDEFTTRRLPRSVQLAIVSVILGGFHTWMAGELSVDLLSSIVAVLIDSAAVALGFVAARLLRVSIETGGLRPGH
jgi:hypothetical protein